MTSYTVNLRNVKTAYELHREIKTALRFPDYYGMNMSALWDCITGDIEIPAIIYIEGINFLPKDMSELGNRLIKILDRTVEWYKDADMELNVVYVD